MKKIFSILSVLALLSVSISQPVLSQSVTSPIGTGSYSGVIKIGEQFTYKVEVKITTPVVLEYKLLKGPDGMVIDSKSGIVTWTPSVKGEFVAEIGVYTGSIKIGSTLLKLKVVDFLGTISGRITNDSGAAIANASVIINKKTVTPGRMDSFWAVALVYTDSDGKYICSGLEQGAYFLRAEANIKNSKELGAFRIYSPVWYEDSPSFEGAKAILIDQANPNFEANMKMHLNPNAPVTTFAYSFVIQKNQPFTYQISIPLPANLLPTEFRLLKTLGNLSVDKTKGFVTWTPAEAGEFSTEIGVYNNNIKFASVILKFKVTGFLGTVKGTIKNDDGLALKSVLVTLYKKISVAQKSNTYSASFSALTDENGNYLIEKVEAGSYFIYAKTAFERIVPPVPAAVVYSPVWYKDSPTMDKADVVEISEASSLVVADLKMHKYIKVEPKVFSISGKVFSGSAPLANAVVLAGVSGKTEALYGIASSVMPLMNLTDPLLGVFSDIISKTVTDREGNYKLQVKEGASYIISSYAEGYQLQYYNGKSNILEADKLTPDKDLTGIDFSLVAIPVATGKISGKIVDDSKNPVRGKAVLYSPINATQVKIMTRTANTNDEGEFVFEKLRDGKYYLQVIPLKEYMPAYYKLNDCGIRDPKQADLITVDGGGSVAGIVVCVKKVSSSGGGKISGYITDDKFNGIAGAVVTAESKDLDQYSYGITESDGSYQIYDLGVGDYHISVEKFGFGTVTKEGASIDYAADSFSPVVNAVLNSSSVTAVEGTNEIPSGFELFQNYPNPFNPATKINFALPVNAFARLTVYDLLGREVTTLINSEMSAGYHEVEFNASNLSSGIYFYRLQADGFTSIKKLILMK